MYTEPFYLKDATDGIEFQSREVEVFDLSGKPKYNIFEANYVGGTPVKVKKVMLTVWYRVTYSVVLEQKIVFGDSPVTRTSEIASKKGAVSWQGISGGTITGGAARFICDSDRLSLHSGITNTYIRTQTWTGFGPWKEAPASWKLRQEEVELDSDDSGSGSGS